MPRSNRGDSGKRIYMELEEPEVSTREMLGIRNEGSDFTDMSDFTTDRHATKERNGDGFTSVPLKTFS